MARRLKYTYHDAGVTGVSIGPRREVTLTARLGHAVAGSEAVVNIRFGGISNFPEVERYFRGVMAEVGQSHAGRIDELAYDESAPPGAGDLALRVELDGYGRIQILCRHVTEEESGADCGTGRVARRLKG